MDLTNIKHIVFDLDNTLWDFSGNSKRILSEIFSEFESIRNSKIDFEKFYEQYRFRNEFLWKEYAFGNVTREEVRFKRFFITLNDFGVNDYALATKAADYYIHHTKNQKELLPGAIELLEYLSPKYQLHIITNGFEEVQFYKLRNSGIEKYFKTVTTAEAASALKPNKKIFDYALSKMNASAAECIYIGDSPEVDGNGAINAGMGFILLEDTPIPRAHSFQKVAHLTGLKAII